VLLVFFFVCACPLSPPTRFPYTTLFRSHDRRTHRRRQQSDLVDPADRRPPHRRSLLHHPHPTAPDPEPPRHDRPAEEGRGLPRRSEEHTSELQSRFDLVCRLLLEKKNTN